MSSAASDRARVGALVVTGHESAWRSDRLARAVRIVVTVFYGTRVPVLEVTALARAERVELDRVAARPSEAVAPVSGEEPWGTWVLWPLATMLRVASGNALVRRDVVGAGRLSNGGRVAGA